MGAAAGRVGRFAGMKITSSSSPELSWRRGGAPLDLLRLWVELAACFLLMQALRRRSFRHQVCLFTGNLSVGTGEVVM